jgi:uncharacterized protein
VRWTWDSAKNRANRRKHGLSFETAQFVFSDPLALSRPDRSTGEERWQTVGTIGHLAVFVVHTWPETEGVDHEGAGRIISARKATAHERKAYEEGQF